MDVRHVEARNSEGLDPIPGTEHGKKAFYGRYQGEIWVDGEKVAQVAFAPAAGDPAKAYEIRYEGRQGQAIVDALEQVLDKKGPVELVGTPLLISRALPLLGLLVVSDVHRREFLEDFENCYCYTVDDVFNSEPPRDGESIEEVAARVHAREPRAEALSKDEMPVIADQMFQREIDLMEALELTGDDGMNEPQASQSEEHAVVVHFSYGSTDLSALHALEDRLRTAIIDAGAGELDGHEIAMDGSEGVFYMYGPDADALFAAARPALEATDFMRGGVACLRYGPPEDGVREDEVRLGGLH